MADVITRFKLETSAWDSKLRDASKSLAAYSKQAELAGKDFDKFTKGGVDAAKSLGNIATSATNTKDKVKELVSAYNDVAKAYNALTEEQKKSDFGKAMAQSLQTLQGRIRDAKAEMNSTGGVLDKLKDRFTVNIDAIKLFNVGLSAAKAALDVAKDAFFASEATVDEWGRVVASSEAVYEGFLTAINNGDISGYLNNINSIVQAARTAYNELDRLGTMKTIQAPAISAQQTENERFRMMIQTGRYIAPVDGRRASMQNGQQLTPDQIHRLESMLQNGMNKVVGLVGNEVKQTTKAIDAYYNKLAKINGMSVSEFRQGTSSMSEFERRLAGAKAYEDYKSQHTITDNLTGYRRYIGGENPYEAFKNWSTFRVDKNGSNSLNELVNLIKQRDQQASSVYGMQSQAYRTMNRAEGITLRSIMGGGGSGGSGGGKGGSTTTTLAPTYAADSIAAQEALVASLTKQWREASSELREGYLKDLTDAKNKLEGMKLVAPKGVDTSGSPVSISTETIIPSIDEIRNYLEKNPIKIPIEAASDKIKGIMKTASITADVVGSIGDAFNAIEDPAAKVAGTIAQAIASVALGYATATANAGSMGPWAWVAFAATGLAEMLTMISTIHSATGYASGGIVGGNSFSGDNMPAMVGNTVVGLNAGELILNKSQQNNIASQLTQAGGGGRLVAKLRGRDILISLERELSETGKGQLATWR